MLVTPGDKLRYDKFKPSIFPEKWFIVYPETLQQSAMHGNIAENRVEQFTTDS